MTIGLCCLIINIITLNVLLIDSIQHSDPCEGYILYSLPSGMCESGERGRLNRYHNIYLLMIMNAVRLLLFMHFKVAYLNMVVFKVSPSSMHNGNMRRSAIWKKIYFFADSLHQPLV